MKDAWAAHSVLQRAQRKESITNYPWLSSMSEPHIQITPPSSFTAKVLVCCVEEQSGGTLCSLLDLELKHQHQCGHEESVERIIWLFTFLVLVSSLSCQQHLFLKSVVFPGSFLCVSYLCLSCLFVVGPCVKFTRLSVCVLLFTIPRLVCVVFSSASPVSSVSCVQLCSQVCPFCSSLRLCLALFFVTSSLMHFTAFVIKLITVVQVMHELVLQHHSETGFWFQSEQRHINTPTSGKSRVTNYNFVSVALEI